MGMRLPPDLVEKIEARANASSTTRPAAPIAERLSEREFMAAVIAEARRRGWLVYHTHDSRRSEPGFPDLVMLRGDRIIVAELKTNDGQLTAAQSNWLDAFRAAGICAHEWRPRDYQNIIHTLS